MVKEEQKLQIIFKKKKFKERQKTVKAATVL